jgi:hypothetical protein
MGRGRAQLWWPMLWRGRTSTLPSTVPSMTDHERYEPGVSVWVEGDVQASGVILEVGGRLLGRGGVEKGWARVRLDASEQEITVGEEDLGQGL